MKARWKSGCMPQSASLFQLNSRRTHVSPAYIGSIVIPESWKSECRRSITSAVAGVLNRATGPYHVDTRRISHGETAARCSVANRLSKCCGKALRALRTAAARARSYFHPGHRSRQSDRRIHPFVWRQSLLPLVLSGRAKHPDRPRCS